MANTKLYVGNLSYDVTEAELSEKFGTIGTCVSAKVIKDRYTNRSKGFGFVEMATEADAEEAIKKLNGVEFSGRKILVNAARPEKEGAPRGSRGGAGGGFSRAPRQ
jgi:RNA recognition motif-containing protein